MEFPIFADQKSEPRKEAILKQIHGLRPILSRQGEVVAAWRTYRGKRLGPYWRLTYRRSGPSHWLYLARDEDLVQEVRRLLEQWQKPMRDERQWTAMRKASKRALRVAKVRWTEELARVGLRLQDYEVRGWRKPGLRPGASTSVAPVLNSSAAT